MARRPDETRGSLIFQEGKNIEGEFYIVAVYDDPASCTIAFSAYELENDCTYSYPMSYSEFDNLFRFDSELMNPSNLDGRFHWVIERLDFVVNQQGDKVLCLANEPTPEGDEDEEEQEAAQMQPKQQGVAPAGAGAGSVDAMTRAKLLQELDTHDDEKLHKGLVRSEAARKKFLSELFAKRQLEQLKASQRLQKADEEREARLAKLDVIKQQQLAKAQAHRENEEAKKSTMAQLEVMMKQKEAQAIRKLIQQKDEEDRGMGREKDAARQRRKMQERSAAEVQAIENQRAQQLARKREEQVVKREQLIKMKDREEADKVRARVDEERAVQVRRREEKDKIIEEMWRLKRQDRLLKDMRREEFERLEELRDKKFAEKEKRRALDEREKWQELREVDAEERETTEVRRRSVHKEYLLKWKVDATVRAVAVRENDKRSEDRDKRLREKEEVRLRKFREQQFLDTMREKARTFAPKDSMGGEGEGEAGASGAEVTQSPFNPTPAETEALTKSFEQQERARRHAEREAKRQQEEAKKSKVEKLGANNPNTSEILRIREWREQDAKAKEAKESAKRQREEAEEQATRDAAKQVVAREEKWVQLEARRREASLERQKRRHEAAVQKIRNVPIGTGLPLALVY